MDGVYETRASVIGRMNWVEAFRDCCQAFAGAKIDSPNVAIVPRHRLEVRVGPQHRYAASGSE
jgi:hypothetical protein